MQPTVSGQREAAGLPSGLGLDAGSEGQRQGPVLFLQQAALRWQGGLPSVLHGQLVPVLCEQRLLHREGLEVVHPGVVLHLVLPRVPVAAARILAGRDAVVAAAVRRLRVEVVVRGAGLEGVGGGEVAALWLQVGTHLNMAYR